MKKLLLSLFLIVFFCVSSYALNYTTITVNQGDTLSTVAVRYLKDTSMWEELLEFNGLTSPSQVVPGITLRIPYSLWISRVAKLQSVNGTVQYLNSATNTWSTAYNNQYIVQNDAIKTIEGSCIVVLDDLSTVRINANTMVTFTRYQYQNSNRDTNVGVAAGSIRLLVTALAGNSGFNVSTPTSVCGVRGTEFFVNVEDNNEQIGVCNGTVFVSTENNEREINSGYMATIENAIIQETIPIPSQINWVD